MYRKVKSNVTTRSPPNPDQIGQDSQFSTNTGKPDKDFVSKDVKNPLIKTYSLVCFIAVLFTLFAIGRYPLNPAEAIPSKTLTFLAETNDDETYLSSAAPANGGVGAMPVVHQSLTVQFSIGADPEPGALIQFSVKDSAGNPSDGIVLSTPSAITNDDGKCRVIIHAKGDIVPDGTLFKVWATYYNPTTGINEVSSHVKVTLMRHNTTFANTPSGVARTVPIHYDDSALGRMLGYTQAAITEYPVPGRIEFVRDVAGGATLKFVEARDETELAFAWHDDSVSPIEIGYNMYQLDEGDFAPPHPPNGFAPLEWRHHVQSTANHELGHFLLFNADPEPHNTIFEKSLMYNINRYWIWKTEKPRSDSEWIPLNVAYPIL